MQPQPNPFLPSIDTIMVLTVAASIIGSLVWLGLLWVIVRGAVLSALRKHAAEQAVRAPDVAPRRD
ncbi:hypothetical protein ACWGOE_05890 [Leucobacter chromiiresistens]